MLGFRIYLLSRVDISSLYRGVYCTFGLLDGVRYITRIVIGLASRFRYISSMHSTVTFVGLKNIAHFYTEEFVI